LSFRRHFGSPLALPTDQISATSYRHLAPLRVFLFSSHPYVVLLYPPLHAPYFSFLCSPSRVRLPSPPGGLFAVRILCRHFLLLLPYSGRCLFLRFFERDQLHLFASPSTLTNTFSYARVPRCSLSFAFRRRFDPPGDPLTSTSSTTSDRRSPFTIPAREAVV